MSARTSSTSWRTITPPHAISAYGSKINQTPNIDRIAKEGMRFDNCFCTNSICTPSRGVILTGQYSHINGVKTLADGLDPARQNVAKLLQAAGYQTGLVGKWHLQKDPTGFDYWNILPGQGVYHDPVFIEMGGRTKKHHGLCHRPHHRLLARLPEAAATRTSRSS